MSRAYINGGRWGRGAKNQFQCTAAVLADSDNLKNFLVGQFFLYFLSSHMEQHAAGTVCMKDGSLPSRVA